MTSARDVNVGQGRGAHRASSRSSRARPTSTRARRGAGASRPRCRRVALRLGRERRRVGLLGRAERGVSLRDRAPAPRGGRRRRRHDLGLAGRERARLGTATRRRAEPDRDQRVRVPDRRPDRARAGAPRRRGRPRAPRLGREIPAERFAEAIDERTALVCCTTLSYRSGHRHDVGAIAEAAHAAGAIVLADSYQACGAVELDVRSLGADVVTGGTVKYLLGTAGLGFMWVRPEVRQALVPTQTGWFADEDIFAMSIADYSPHRSARRFDSGTPPVPALYAGVAGLSLVEEVEVQAIEAHVRGLVDRLLDGLESLGATVPTPRDPSRRGPLVCVRSSDVTALVAALAAERMIVSSREDKLRVALHLYNVDEDVDRLLEALARHRALLA